MDLADPHHQASSATTAHSITDHGHSHSRSPTRSPVKPSMLAAPVSRTAFAEAETLLNNALGLTSLGSTSESLQTHAKVLLGRIDMLCHEFDTCIHRLKSLKPVEDSKPGHLYDKVVTLMHWALLGYAYHAKEDYNLALGALDAGIKMLDHPLEKPPPPKVMTSRPDEIQWDKWAVETLYGHAVVLLEIGEKDRAENSMKQYLKIAASLQSPDITGKTVTVHRQLILSYLAKSTKPAKPVSICSSHTPGCDTPHPLSGILSESTFPQGYAPLGLEQCHNFRNLITSYEKLVTALLPFPRGEDSSPVDRSRHEKVNEAYDWWAFLETLYRGTKHTFQSLKLLRYLGHTFTSMLALCGDNYSEDERVEAIAVIDAYKFSFDKKINAAVLQKKKKLQESRKAALPPSPRSESAQGVDVVDDDDFDHALIAIGGVHGETLADAVGVLISGARICLMSFEKTEDAKKAATYIDRASELLQQHSSTLSDSDAKQLSEMVLKYQGVVYGELGRDVNDSDARKRLQRMSVEAFKGAIALVGDGGTADEDAVHDGWDLFYQNALTLAEVGEIDQAMDSLQKSLTMNSASAPSWNLLAMLLSCRKDIKQALEVCDAGWKECVASLSKPTSGSGDLPESYLNWDSVPTAVKEDLFNLKLTQLVLEGRKLGPKEALENLQSLFVLFRKMFGSLCRTEDSSSLPTSMVGHHRPSVDGSVMNSYSHSDRPHSQASTSSSMPQSSTSTPNGTLPHILGMQLNYSFRARDLYICLWLTASSLYRQLGNFDEARAAISEAEKLSESWSRLENKVRNSPSRICKPVGADLIVPFVVQQLQEKKKSKKAAMVNGLKAEDVKRHWGLVGNGLKRVLADILFESTKVKEAEYRKSLIVPPKHRLAKYLPADMVEASSLSDSNPIGLRPFDPLLSRRGSAITLAKSFKSMGSNQLLGSSSTPAGSSHVLNTGSNPVINGNQPQNNSTASAAVTNGATPSIASSSQSIYRQAPSMVTTTSTVPSTTPVNNFGKPMTVSTLIEDYLLITLLDDDHVPARVQLAQLYKEKGDLALAEYWYERACKRSKSRGAGGGCKGLSTYYGGTTAHWGWESWAGLGKVLMETGRAEAARDCLYFAVGIERVSPLRGFQCLRQFVH
ncbi:hypothetical protein HDV05_000278 [Chytridiales sp. JEL 0842]|nr:hypothetical protein HDV05_000278 [Chytridiales sp. JEL 0842]